MKLTVAGSGCVGLATEAMDGARRLFAGPGGVRFADTPMQALEGADALLIVTEWKACRCPWPPEKV